MRFQNPNIQEIKITGLNATVLFKVTENKFIDIECDNPEVQIKEVHQCIIVADKDTVITSSGDIKRSSVFFGSNTDRIVINNNIIVNGSIINGGRSSEVKEMPKATIIILVPFDYIRYLDLAIVGICHTEKISKRLSIKTAISASLDISHIEKVSLDASGCTHALLKCIKMLEIDASGQSYIDIQNVEELKIDASGQSEIEVKSNNLTDAKIDVSGMGSIQIDSKTIENLEVDLSGMSQLNVFGKVLRKHIDTSGMSNYMIR
jgi:predicted nucleic-acid-binding Zn-ribbon protein